MSGVTRVHTVSTALRLAVAALLILSTIACSPEATRVRGSGLGADVGNHSPNSPEPSTAPTIVERP